MRRRGEIGAGEATLRLATRVVCGASLQGPGFRLHSSTRCPSHRKLLSNLHALPSSTMGGLRRRAFHQTSAEIIASRYPISPVELKAFPTIWPHIRSSKPM